MSDEDRDVDVARVDQRLRREMRIRDTAQYRALARDGRRFFTRHLVVQYRPGDGLHSRFGVTASRRVGGAVVRNRLKRWVRENSRRTLGRIPGTWDVVWILRRGAGSCSHGELDEQMDSFWRFLERRARSS